MDGDRDTKEKRETAMSDNFLNRDEVTLNFQLPRVGRTEYAMKHA